MDKLFPVETLRRCRQQHGISQEHLGKLLQGERRWPFTQLQVSSMERGISGYWERVIQERATAYLREQGFDTDPSGAIIWVPICLTLGEVIGIALVWFGWQGMQMWRESCQRF